MSNSTKRRGLHPAVAFVLGFLLALILIVGATVGVVIYALNYKLDKLSANKDSEGNYLYINADPDNGGVGTILDLVKKVQTLSKEAKNLSLGELEVTVPVLGKLTDKIEESLSGFVKLEEGEVRNTKLGELSEFVQTLSKRVDIARLIGATPDNKIVTYLCYGVTDVEYDDGTYTAKYKDAEGNIHDCILEQDNENKLTGAYYTADGEQVYTPSLTFELVNDRVDGVRKELKICEIIDVSEEDKIIGSIKNSTIDTIADDINGICIQQLFADDVYAGKTNTSASGETTKNPSAKFYRAVSDSEIAAATDHNAEYIYYVSDGGNYVLAGGNGKLTKDEYDNYVADSVALYTCGEGKILFDSAYLYYKYDANGDLYLERKGEEDEGRLTALPADHDCYTYGAPSKLWKLLLYNDVQNLGNVEIAYDIKSINKMISNVTKNTQNTNLRDLHEAGILTFQNPAELEYHVRWNDLSSNPPAVMDKILGDMTLTEVIQLMVKVITNPTILIPTTPPVT